MTPEQKLMALMAADTPPAQDPLFEIAVQEKLARQRAVARFSSQAMLAVLFSGVLIGLLSVLVSSGTAGLWSMMAAVGSAGLAALVVWSLRRAAA